MSPLLQKALSPVPNAVSDLEGNGWQASATAALVLAINAALCICAVEYAYYLSTADFSLPALGYIPLSLIASAVAVGIALSAVLVGLWAAEKLAGVARIPLFVSTAAVAAPQLFVTARLFDLTTLTSWVSLGLLAGLLAAIGWTIARVRLTGWSWAVSVVLCGVTSIYVLTRDYSLGRAAAGSFDLYFLYVHAVPLLSLLATVGAYLIFRHCQGSPAPLAIAAPAGIGGALLCYLVLPRLPISSSATLGYLRFVSTLMLVLGASRLPVIRRARSAVPLGAAAVAASVYLANFGSGGTSPGWSLSNSTVLAATAVQSTGVLEYAADEQEIVLKEQPEYRLGLGVVTTAQAWNAARERTEADKYSVLLITVDALRFDAVQYSGRAKENWTPHINETAPRCHRFLSAYAQGGWTSISLPALLWSKYPRLIKFIPLFEDNEQGLHWTNRPPKGRRIKKRFQSPIKEPDPNLAKILGQRGYSTIAVTNDDFTGYFTPQLGFARHFDDIAYPKALAEQRDRRDQRGAHLDEVAADVTIDRLSALSDQRFFVWTHFFAPHGPYTPPEEYDIPFERYHGEIYFADLQVGRVLDHLKRIGRDRDTIVVITSDHGESFWEHNNNTHGKELYDHAMRVPLLFCIPGTQATEIATPVGLVDIGPTLLDYLGAPIPTAMHGFSLRGMMQNEKGVHPRPPVFIETWQNEPKTLERELDRIAVVHGNHKLILDLNWNVFSLFDLRRDPREKHNLLEAPNPQSERKFLELGGHLLGWRDIKR